jgi:hypothetical protein
LLATVNRLLGSYTLMIAVPVGALFASSVFINVSSTAALSVAAAHAGPGQAAAEPRQTRPWAGRPSSGNGSSGSV